MLTVRDMGCFDLSAMTDRELRELQGELEYRLYSITKQLDEARLEEKRTGVLADETWYARASRAARITENQVRTVAHELIRRRKEGRLAQRSLACFFLEEAQRSLSPELYKSLLDRARARGNAGTRAAVEDLEEAVRE